MTNTPSSHLAAKIGVSVADLSHYRARRFSRIGAAKLQTLRDFFEVRRNQAVNLLRALADGRVVTVTNAIKFGVGHRLSERDREVDGRSKRGIFHKGRRYVFDVRRVRIPNSNGMVGYWMLSTEMARAKKFLKMLDKQSKAA